MNKLMMSGAILLVAGLVQAGTVPELVNYQGRLTDESGTPLATADYALRFEVWSDPVAGTRVWGPLCFDLDTGGTPTDGHKFKVPVVQGYFNVVLDKDTGYDDCAGTTSEDPPAPVTDAFSEDSRYVEIAVWNDGTSAWESILPRQQVLSAPYAVSAERARNGVPPGTIVPYAGPGLPSGGWLLCNGAEVSRTEYDSLFAAIDTTWGSGNGTTTFNLPDLMTDGLFLRGGTPGVEQDDATALPTTPFETPPFGDAGRDGRHVHRWRGYWNHGGDGQTAKSRYWQTGDPLESTTCPSSQPCWNLSGNAGDHRHMITHGGDPETRPVNAAVRWIIKY